jgi:hypothetical protein
MPQRGRHNKDSKWYNNIDASGLSFAISYKLTLAADVVISTAMMPATISYLRGKILYKNSYPADITSAMAISHSQWNASVISEATLGTVKLPNWRTGFP